MQRNSGAGRPAGRSSTHVRLHGRGRCFAIPTADHGQRHSQFCFTEQPVLLHRSGPASSARARQSVGVTEFSCQAAKPKPRSSQKGSLSASSESSPFCYIHTAVLWGIAVRDTMVNLLIDETGSAEAFPIQPIRSWLGQAPRSGRGHAPNYTRQVSRHSDTIASQRVQQYTCGGCRGTEVGAAVVEDRSRSRSWAQSRSRLLPGRGALLHILHRSLMLRLLLKLLHPLLLAQV